MAKRRANGEGTLRKRPNGTWELTVKIGRRDDGKWITKSFYAESQKKVKEKLKRYQEQENVHEKYSLSFCEWSDFWLEQHKQKITATTYEGYRYTLKLLKRFFGAKLITEIVPIDIEDMMQALVDEGRSKSAVSSCRGVMYQIMNKAVANGLVKSNPVA
ncbi:MAG: phage integrase central domain-containing protein, partial [Faecousia sp.]